jgi:pimeloyl-ACP methyl ester carboxylesterase
MRITKHFLNIGDRRVHYTRAGEGPAVCLLHASPCSAKVLRLPQEVFAGCFTALAFDTPGFGLSDLLPLAQPEIEDFADALAESLTELGIEQTATYGRHTGASIAVEFARRHAARCSMALTDGFPVFSAKAAEDRLNRYLLPIVPQWDGSHLVWLWYRYRDQHVFWPWHNQILAFRAETDAPDPEFNHRTATGSATARPSGMRGSPCCRNCACPSASATARATASTAPCRNIRPRPGRRRCRAIRSPPPQRSARSC